ncbi:hypothetical protein KM915_19545 [Cytobacillus oceanisediminis]|nr:hypothetical protein [Cytobacillus oceanisediminis]
MVMELILFNRRGREDSVSPRKGISSKMKIAENGNADILSAFIRQTLREPDLYARLMFKKMEQI